MTAMMIFCCLKIVGLAIGGGGKRNIRQSFRSYAMSIQLVHTITSLLSVAMVRANKRRPGPRCLGRASIPQRDTAHLSVALVFACHFNLGALLDFLDYAGIGERRRVAELTPFGNITQ